MVGMGYVKITLNIHIYISSQASSPHSWTPDVHMQPLGVSTQSQTHHNTPKMELLIFSLE